jgi:hypothetical protein
MTSSNTTRRRTCVPRKFGREVWSKVERCCVGSLGCSEDWDRWSKKKRKENEGRVIHGRESLVGRELFQREVDGRDLELERG